MSANVAGSGTRDTSNVKFAELKPGSVSVDTKRPSESDGANAPKLPR